MEAKKTTAFLRLALAQINTTVGDLAGNQKKIIERLKQAKAAQADLVVFPELAICGYPPEDLLLKEHFVDDNLKALNHIVKQVSGITAVVGFVDKDRFKNTYNAAAIIHKQRLRGVYRKMELPNYGVFDEKRYFMPGRENIIFKIKGMLFGVSICEDIWQDNGAYRGQANAGAKLLINISASPYHAGKILTRKNLLSRRARETAAYVAYVNLVGGQDELVFDGGSAIFDPQGKMLTLAKQFEEDLALADIDISRLVKKKNAAIRGIKVVSLPSIWDNAIRGKLPRSANKIQGRLEEIYHALVLGTRDYIQKNNFKKVLIGLSGGIDSTLVALIACDAIGRENVAAVSMPSMFTSPDTKTDAEVLANNLGIKFMCIPINTVFQAYLKSLKHEFSGTARGIAEENLQARIRGNILMAFSNKFKWLVLTTGNKSETSVGYCTLYGDMAGGFAVIKDVPKTLVYELARYRNDLASGPLIPESVFTRPPTAELKPNQTDQDTLPPYGVLDKIIKLYIEEDKSYNEIIRKGIDANTLKDVINMVDINEYKRRQAPPGVKITPKSFGRDRRLPITTRYKEF